MNLEHADGVTVTQNECSGEVVGVELHNSPGARVSNNYFDFTGVAAGCEINLLALGEKIDFGRVVPGAGVCLLQD